MSAEEKEVLIREGKEGTDRAKMGLPVFTKARDITRSVRDRQVEAVLQRYKDVDDNGDALEELIVDCSERGFSTKDIAALCRKFARQRAAVERCEEHASRESVERHAEQNTA